MWGLEENYYYKVYYESTLLRDSSELDEFFEDYEDAEEEAKDFIEERIEEWKADMAWDEEYDDEDSFNIYIEEWGN